MKWLQPTKSLSALQMASKYDVNKNTAWLFMSKYRENLQSSETLKINNNDNSVIYVDKFVGGG